MMTLIETVSKQLKISQDDLVHQSIQTFLERKLAYVESELFVICKNYGVNNIMEMDGFLQDGTIKEDECFEDYFHLDHLQSERITIQSLLQSISSC